MSVKIKITHPGSLERVGYNLGEGEEKRRHALKKVIKKYGILDTKRKINALRILMKDHPHYYKLLTRDYEYITSFYGKPKGFWD